MYNNFENMINILSSKSSKFVTKQQLKELSEEGGNDEAYYQDWIDDVVKSLVPMNTSLKGESYAYVPMNSALTKWQVSDGAILNKNFIQILTEYAYSKDDAKQFFDFDAEEFVRDYVIKKPIVRQQEFEGGGS
jgi:hypothetical protein